MRKFRPAKSLAEANARLEMAEHMLEKMHEHHTLALTKATSDAPTVEPIEPDVPPDEVLAAMKEISPVPDKTYEANWQFWERNKERARLHPKSFAEEIIAGAAWEPMTQVLIVPERVPVT